MNESGGSVQTVLGRVATSDLGPTLIHEHIQIDMRQAYPGPEGVDPAAVPELHELGEARRDFTRFPGVIVLDDPTVAIEELDFAVKQGCRTVIDQTTIGLRPPGHADNLRRIAQATGLHVIAGTGFYLQTAHPDEVAHASPESLADIMMSELTVGMDGTDVKAGVIGEIGLNQPTHPAEWKVLEAACLAQRASGVPLLIHPHYGGNSRVAPDAARFILERGVDPGMVCMGHMDGNMDLQYQRDIADLGINISFDGFGLELYYDSDDYNHNTHDSLRVQFLLTLLEEGYGDRLLISHDVATKLQLRRMGGWGYAHLFENIRPALLHRGVDAQQWRQLIEVNPRRLFEARTPPLSGSARR